MAVKPIPDGYHSLTPYLVVHDGKAAMDYYKKAFGAKERLTMPTPDGKVAHAEMTIGNSIFMMADECPEMDAKGPKIFGGSPVKMLIYVEDVDAAFKKALAAGGIEKRPLKNQFYGDRSGMLEDPFGHSWTIASHVEDVSEEECNRRFEEMMKQHGGN